MLGEAQDVLRAAETSLARHQHHRRHRNGRRPTEEAPHCVTCCCLDNRQVTCSQSCASSRRHSDRKNTTVDELLREMNLNTPIMSDEDTYVHPTNEVEDESSPVPLARPSRRAAGSYCEANKSPGTSARSCERWTEVDNNGKIRSKKPSSAEQSERHSDGSKRKWKNSRRLQQLLRAGDRNVPLQQPEQPAKATDGDEDESTSETLAEETHVRELKLVRLQFIERIHDEVTKLHRLQRHLDGCCSPPPTTLTRRRSVSTMTSARQTESNVPEQF